MFWDESLVHIVDDVAGHVGAYIRSTGPGRETKPLAQKAASTQIMVVLALLLAYCSTGNYEVVLQADWILEHGLTSRNLPRLERVVGFHSP